MSDEEKLEIISKFSSGLLNNMKDIPEEFAKVINEDFWKIIGK